MRATALEVTAERAVVELRPGWLARLLGARTLVVELKRPGGRWMTAATEDILSRGLPRDRLLLEALDFRPVVAPPRALARPR